MKDTLQELFMDIYKRTLKDNQEDMLKNFNVISKLCVILENKNIINEEELKEILDLIIDIQLENEKLHKVLDKIKEYVKEWREDDGSGTYGTFELLELLEEIE